MKKEILIRVIFIFCFCLTLNAVSAQTQNNAIDATGDITFVAYSGSSAGIQGFAFVLLDNCPNGTAIGLTDEEWTVSGTFPAEGWITWTNNTGATIAKGTVIKIAGTIGDYATTSTNIGSVTADANMTTPSGDQVFAVTGTRSSPGTHLAFVGAFTQSLLCFQGTPYGSGCVSGTPSALVFNTSGTLYGVNITSAMGGVKYNGSTVCNGTVAQCVTMINTQASWSNTGFTGLTTPALFFAAIPNSFGGSVLPIELISFTGKNEKAQNLLSWKTATETNNKGFDIETSKDGVNFQVLEFVKGRGTTSETQNYTFTHRLSKNESGILYYRLKQMDFDGQFEYSKIIVVRSEGKQNSIAVYPNPSNGLYTIVPNEKDEIEQISLMSITGQSIDVNMQNNQLDLSNEPAGVYFLQVNGENIKLIKN